jgi:nucleoporin GLE1
MLLRLPDLPRVFWARLVQRTGGWAVPCPLPSTEPSGAPLDGPARRKAAGMRDGEGTGDYTARVAACLRVYFAVLHESGGAPAPLADHYRTPRAWAWLARVCARDALLRAPAAPLAAHALLDVLGANAREAWGVQWVKLLALLYASAAGTAPVLLGGDGPEARAARVRVMLEVERLLGAAR